MSKNEVTRPRSSKKLAWLILPLLLLAVLITGGFSLSRTNAVHATSKQSPINGGYIFHAITLEGAQEGLSIHGTLALTSLQKGVVGHAGTLCLSTLDPRGCAIVTGTTPDDVHVVLTIHAIAGYSVITLTGAFDSDASGHGEIRGTFLSGSGAHQSSGDWTAHVPGRTLTADGTWRISGHITVGPDAGHRFFHGTLDLFQLANNTLIGGYCLEKHDTGCIPVMGENNNGYVFIYVGIPIKLKLRGTFRSANQLVGTVEVFHSADRGIWSASRVA